MAVPQAPRWASPELNGEVENHYPQALGDLGRLEKYVRLGVLMYVCGPLTALKRGRCVCLSEGVSV